jgi:microcystin-dependent protein
MTTTAAYVRAESLTGLHENSLSFIGGGQPHDNQQPYLTLNFCIALQGIYPSRV